MLTANSIWLPHARPSNICATARIVGALNKRFALYAKHWRVASLHIALLRICARTSVLLSGGKRRSTEKTFNPWMVFATGAACALIVLGAVLFQTTRASRNETIVDEVIANHVRSLLATHLLDVSSSDQHTVKPWFDGKIDFAPEVRDLSGDGFPLIGGRLDYLGGRTVVALVYHRNKHPVNVFIMPATTDRNTSPSAITRRGYNILSWTHNEMKDRAVSDLNEAELRRFTELLTR